ncbi:MAG TPA: glycosyltransferase [Longimicrobiales bacterium]
MKVLYVSKASWVVAHRDKLRFLARIVDLHTVVPERWGRSPREDPDPTHPAVEALPVICHGHNHLHVYRGLGAVMDRCRPDLVHADEEPYSVVTLQVARLCGSRGVPFVFFAYQNLLKRLPPPFGALQRHVFRKSAGGMAASQDAARVLRTGGFQGPLAVLPQMGIDPERFRPSPEDRRRRRGEVGVRESSVVAGYVGRLVPEKGVDVFLEAVARVPGMCAWVVGDGPHAGTLVRRSREVGLGDRVRFTGHVASLEVASWMAALDILVLPSRTTRTWTEQFGRVLVEAMACGVPVVVSDAGQMAEVVGGAGCVVPEGDVSTLAGTLQRLAEDPQERAKRGEAGRVRAVEAYSQECVTTETVAFYRRVLSGGEA